MIVCYSCPQLIPVITLRMKIQNVRMKIQDVRMKIQDVRMKIKVALFSHLVSSFCIFIFWSFLWCHHPNFRWIFHDNSKKKNLRFFSFYSAHYASSIKTEEGGVCISLVGKNSLPRLHKLYYCCIRLKWLLVFMFPDYLLNVCFYGMSNFKLKSLLFFF